METLLHFLYVEDNPQDAELVRATLEADNLPCTITRVETPDAFITALTSGSFHLVLSDFSLPHFNGLDVLRLLRERHFDIPFIVVSGTIGEQLAVELLKNGATDYILKDQLAKLSPAIKRALVEYDEHTKLKQATEDLKQREALLQEAQRIAHIGNWVWNPGTNVIILSAELYNIFGLLPEQENLTYEAFSSRIFPADLSYVQSSINTSTESQTPLDIEFRILLPDGRTRYIHFLGRHSKSATGGQYIMIGTAQDITERRLAETEIRKFATLLDKAKDAITVRTMDNRIIYWNKGAEKMYGWTQEEVVGSLADRILFKKEFHHEFPEMFTQLKLKSEWYGELHQVTKHGADIITQNHWSVVYGEAGQHDSILAISTDVTEKKQYEEQLLRMQRLENIGTLASGIAHDLNNILSPILLASEILSKKISDPGQVTLIERIHQNATRGAEVVKQVLSFVRGVEGKHSSIQLRHLIDEIGKIIKETFPKSIYLETNIPKDLSLISGDPTQLHQVLLNLCVNARDAMTSGGKLRISAENIYLDEAYTKTQAAIIPGNYVLLKFSDSGMGIPRTIIDKIFDPFFTTKEVGKGTGLGLFTVHSIIKNHGGFIHVTSQVGEGTTFEIYLPSAASHDTHQEPTPEPPMPRGNNENILVVDDESGIREITKEILTAHGYQVMTANDGTEAMVLFAQHHGEVNLVLTDLRMPYMDGVAVIRALKKIDPSIRIIASSGSADHYLAEQHDLHAFLEKPYTASTLLNTIHSVLQK